MPIIRRFNCVPLPIVVSPVVAVVMLEDRVARCVHTVGSGTQLDLLMMGIKMPETC